MLNDALLMTVLQHSAN